MFHSTVIYENKTIVLISLIQKVIKFHNISVATFEQNATLKTNILQISKFQNLKPALIVPSQIKTTVLLFLSNPNKSFMLTCRITASYSFCSRIGIVWRLHCFAFDPGEDLM